MTGAHVVATDTWVSMGQEEMAAKRIKDYEGYQVHMYKYDTIPTVVFQGAWMDPPK